MPEGLLDLAIDGLNSYLLISLYLIIIVIEYVTNTEQEERYLFS